MEHSPQGRSRVREIHKEARENVFRDVERTSEVIVITDIKESEGSKMTEWPKA